ncbi:hypothetical protein MRB53_040985 [Persea americana]|nr:hypothetical protein MRB53_040985 [Persea americana]
MHIIESQDQVSLIYLVDKPELHDVDDARSLTERGHEIITLRETDKIKEDDDLKSIHLSIRHLRHLQQMSFFHHELDSKIGSSLWNDTPLSSRPVCELSYRAGEGDFAAVLTLFGQDPEVYANWLSQLINGMIVTIADKLVAQPLDPTTSRIVGNALIRGIDVQSQIIEVITPDHVLAALSEVPDNVGASNFVAIPAPWTSACPLLKKQPIWNSTESRTKRKVSISSVDSRSCKSRYPRHSRYSNQCSTLVK